LDEVRVVDAFDQLPGLLEDRIDRHLPPGPARILERDADPLRGLRLWRDPEPALEEELRDVDDPDAFQLVVQSKGAIAFRAGRDQHLDADHLPDLRVVVAHPLAVVNFALPQLVVAAGPHAGPA